MFDIDVHFYFQIFRLFYSSLHLGLCLFLSHFFPLGLYRVNFFLCLNLYYFFHLFRYFLNHRFGYSYHHFRSPFILDHSHFEFFGFLNIY